MIAGPPPLSSLGTVLELEGPSPGAARWDTAAWGTARWDTAGWRDVTGLGLSVEVEWGADRPVGVLAACAAGRWTARTYDPLRILDPSNVESPYAVALRPGSRVRVRYGSTLIRQGWLDTIDYSIADGQGTLQASDGIPLLAQARLDVVAAGAPPATLRAFARWLVAKVSVPVAVEPDGPDMFGGEGSMEWTTRPPGWTGNTSIYASQEDPRAVEGSRVLRVVGNASLANPTVYMTEAPVSPGDVVTYSAWGAPDTGNAFPGQLRMEAKNLSGQWNGVSSILQWNAGTALGTPLTQRSGTYTVPADGSITALRLRLLIYGNAVPVPAGESWIFDAATIYVPQADPPIGGAPNPTGTVAVWDWLQLAAADALYAVWLDRSNVLRFRSYGSPRDTGLALGGDGIPLEDLAPSASLDGVYNVVSAIPLGGGAAVEVRDLESVGRYGERRLDRTRPTPSASAWVANVLADRSAASLDHRPRSLRLRDAADLTLLADAGMVDAVRLQVESVSPPVEVSASLLGLTLRADPEAGWSGDVVTYLPAATWEDAVIPPPEPPDPTPPPTARVVRTYGCAKDSRVSLTSGGSKYGAGASGTLPVGAWSGWQNRALLGFATIPWDDVAAVVSARLLVTTSSQVNVGFGGSPKVEARRITGSWSEGSASTPSSGNAVVWPGPAVTSTGSKQTAVTRTEGARVGLDVSAIARAWAPSAAGGSGAVQQGIALYSAGETSTTYTTEFLSRETSGSASDPVLELTLDVFT